MAEQVADRFDRHRLTPDEREQLYQEGVEWYRRYGVSDRSVPADRAAFQEKWDYYCAEVLELNPAAEWVLDSLRRSVLSAEPLLPPQLTLLRPLAKTALARHSVFRVVRVCAFGGLPPLVRGSVRDRMVRGRRRRARRLGARGAQRLADRSRVRCAGSPRARGVAARPGRAARAGGLTMARRKVTVELEPMLGAFAVVSVAGSPEERILDAAAHLMRTYGLKRWSMEDVAERAAIGRTSVYRAFSTRDELVHAVLARELRATIGKINAAAAASSSAEDGIIEGALAGLAALRSSLVEQLLRTDPSTILPFLTTEAGPLIALTRQLLVAQARAAGVSIAEEHAGELAEIAARLGLSFVLTRETVFPVDDDEAFRSSLRQVLRPVLTPLFAAGASGA